MSARRAQESSAQTPWIHSPRLHLVMYSMLLVATPFLLLRNFLQPAIARLSRADVELAGIEVPVVPVLAAGVLIAGLIYFRAYLTRIRLLAGVLVLLLDALAQQIADYYFGHGFYDLQQNWHYLAYLTFAIMVYRDLAPRGVGMSRIMLVTFLLATSFSAFDESFQLGLSGRAFEMGDIAKDVWGTIMGIVLVYVGGSSPAALRADWSRLRHKALRGYLENPASTIILLTVLAFLFLCLASLLTEMAHCLLVVLLTVAGFIVFFLLFHLSQRRWVSYSMAAILLLALSAQTFSLIKHHADGIVCNTSGLVVYKGIPIPLFDVMIFPDGTFRPVPKKHSFSPRDRRFLLEQKTDIILIGSGVHGRGGRGFPEDAISQFIFNPFINDGTQVIILPNSEACQVFNRLKREGRNVLFVLHSTC